MKEMKRLLGICALALVVLASLSGYDHWEAHQIQVKIERAVAAKSAAQVKAYVDGRADRESEEAATKSLEDQFMKSPPRAPPPR